MEVPDELLRQALEVAHTVAVLGSRQRPPLPAPPSLRPYLRFQKLPTAALTAVRRTVEEDDAFRKLVMGVATEDVVDRPSWLWLHRPDGWESELAAFTDETTNNGRAATGRAKGADRVTSGRLEAAEARSRRLSAELGVLRGEVARAQDARAKADADAERSRGRADELERAAARGRARLERTAEELQLARDDAASAKAELEALRPAAAEAPVPAVAADEPVEPGQLARPVEPSGALEAPVLPVAALDALDRAAGAASSLAAALSALVSSLTAGAAQDGAGTGVAASTARIERREAVHRRALRFPRGMHAGTPEADVWLLTEAGGTVVVDGYNVAKLGWPDLPLADQRDRLLGLLDDLACRYGTAVQVVFDGADVGPVRARPRRCVAVRFSPPSVLADDVIREIVAARPADEAVVVVTNDQAIVRDVRSAGANVVTSGGLLTVARR